MGTINAAFGTIKGKVGNLRFADWNGVNTVAQQPSAYTDANTIEQQGNRSTFKALAQVGRQVVAAIRVGLAQFKTKTTPWATFMAKSSTAFNIVGGVVKLSMPESLIFSQGNLPKPVNVEIVDAGGSKTKFTWDDNSVEFGAHADDMAQIVVVNAAGEVAAFFANVATRAAKTATISSVPYGNPSLFHTYMFFTSSQDRNQHSDQLYTLADL